MDLNQLLFIIPVGVAVISALGMLFSRNAVYAALFLIVNFASVGVLYLLLQAPFIAVVQITVYAGAIMVLFLFVIMLLGAEQIGHDRRSRWFRPLAIGLGLVLLAETAYIVITNQAGLPSATMVAEAFGSPAEIGSLLFQSYLLPFEITSILLLVAMIGAVVLTKRK